MKLKKTLYYAISIAIIILLILMSMLNLDAVDEQAIAKWAMSGILSLLVAAVYLMVIGNDMPWRYLVPCSIFLPLLIIVISGVLLEVLGYGKLFTALLLSRPFLPTTLIFMAPWPINVGLKILKIRF